MNVLVGLYIVLVLVYLSVQRNYHLDWICDLELDLVVVFVHTYMCFITNEILLIPRKSHQVYRLYTTRDQKQSNIPITNINQITNRNKQWLPTADIKSNKVLEKNNFSSGKFLSKSSKLQLFLSHQIHHIEQWGTAFKQPHYDDTQAFLANKLIDQLQSLASPNGFQTRWKPQTTT